MKQVNFNNYRTKMTEKDVNEILLIVGARCREKTKKRLRSILTYGLNTVPQYGILERLIKEDHFGWMYVAGQSYPDEIRTVREVILNG